MSNLCVFLQIQLVIRTRKRHMSVPRAIVWFRNDLRLADNAIVAAAMTYHKKGHEIVPIYCFDDRFMSANNVIDRHAHRRIVGEPKMGPFRAQFVMDSVNDLKQSLQKIKSDLIIFYERPENVIPGGKSPVSSVPNTTADVHGQVPAVPTWYNTTSPKCAPVPMRTS
jgi:deoxyribodipyrimidine photolyase